MPAIPTGVLSARRLKKIGYRSRLGVSRALLGSDALIEGAEHEGPEEADRSLGVDRSEVSEHHLQAALSSNHLAASEPVKGNTNGKSKVYHIPTPETKTVLTKEELHELYPPGSYSDPVSYVRSSDTVEESLRGPTYTLDEDDGLWLEEHNDTARKELEAALASRPLPPSKGKSKERKRQEALAALLVERPELNTMTEDQFEMVMTVFEKVTSDRCPMLHLNLTTLPTLESLLPSFDNDSPLAALAKPQLPSLPFDVIIPHSGSTSSASTSKAAMVSAASAANSSDWSPSDPWRNLAALKPLASTVYPWWKERREERQGKPIVPPLNFDESDDTDPYVCFRRREVKIKRVTRKADLLHIEKLIRLQSELESAVSLVALVAQRERVKLAGIMHDRKSWETMREFIDLKRAWAISGPAGGNEDDELLGSYRKEKDTLHSENSTISSVPKKKRRLDEPTSLKTSLARRMRSSAEPSPATATSGTTSSHHNGSASAASGGMAGMGAAVLERIAQVQNYVERECSRKKEADLGWEEASDTAFLMQPSSAALKAYRPIESDAHYCATHGSSPFACPPSCISRSGRPASFRKRVGRGGRMVLDRRLPAPSSVPNRLAEWPNRHTSQKRADPEKNGDKPSQTKNNEQHNAAQKTPSGNQHQSATSLAEKSADPENPHHNPHRLSAPPLTGPFAFSPNLRPEVLVQRGHIAHYTSGPFSKRCLKAEVCEAESSSPPSPVAKESAPLPLSAHVPIEIDTEDTEPMDDHDGGDHPSPDRMSNASSDLTELSKSSSQTAESVTASTQATDLEMELAEPLVAEVKPSRPGRLCDLDKFAQSVSWNLNESDEEGVENEAEGELRFAQLREQWRYDDEAGRWAGLGLCGLGGMEEDEEAVMDDFDQRFLRFRMSLLEEADLCKLSTDLTHIMQAQVAAEQPPPLPVGYVGSSSSTGANASANSASPATSARSAALIPAGAIAPAPQVTNTGTSVMSNIPTSTPNRPAAFAASAFQQLTPLQQQQLLQQQQIQLRLAQAQAQAQAQAAQQVHAHAQAQAAQAQARAQAQAQAQRNSNGQLKVSGLQQRRGPGNFPNSPLNPSPQPQYQQTPHPLSQSHSFNSPGTPSMQGTPGMQGGGMPMQGSQSGGPGMQGPSGPHSSPFMNGQGFPSAMPSPQLQAQYRTSSSPIPNGPGSPHFVQQQQAQMRMGNGQVHSPDLASHQASQFQQQQHQAQQQQQQAQMLAAAAAANPQLNGMMPANASVQQLLAMKAALSQNPQLQLKLPPQRALAVQMAGQTGPGGVSYSNVRSSPLLVQQQLGLGPGGMGRMSASPVPVPATIPQQGGPQGQGQHGSPLLSAHGGQNGHSPSPVPTSAQAQYIGAGFGH